MLDKNNFDLSSVQTWHVFLIKFEFKLKFREKLQCIQ